MKDALPKIPRSVLVVIHTPALQVLLIRRADCAQDYWQSVTGSKDTLRERWAHTAAREVWEETGIDCRSGQALAAALIDRQIENVYAIYPQWRWRYAPGVSLNRERVFSLCVPQPQAVRLSPREHTAAQWLPWAEAAQRCASASNAAAITCLPRWWRAAGAA